MQVLQKIPIGRRAAQVAGRMVGDHHAIGAGVDLSQGELNGRRLHGVDGSLDHIGIVECAD